MQHLIGANSKRFFGECRDIASFSAGVAASSSGCVPRITAGLLTLFNTYRLRDFEEALVEALERDRVHVVAVRHVLERNRAAQSLPPRTDLRIAPAKHADPVVTPRNLGSYDGLSKKENTDDHS